MAKNFDDPNLPFAERFEIAVNWGINKRKMPRPMAERIALNLILRTTPREQINAEIEKYFPPRIIDGARDSET